MPCICLVRLSKLLTETDHDRPTAELRTQLASLRLEISETNSRLDEAEEAASENAKVLFFSSYCDGTAESCASECRAPLLSSFAAACAHNFRHVQARTLMRTLRCALCARTACARACTTSRSAVRVFNWLFDGRYVVQLKAEVGALRAEIQARAQHHSATRTGPVAHTVGHSASQLGC